MSKKGKLIIRPLPEPEELEPYSPWTSWTWKDDAFFIAFVVILIVTAFGLAWLSGILCR